MKFAADMSYQFSFGHKSRNQLRFCADFDLTDNALSYGYTYDSATSARKVGVYVSAGVVQPLSVNVNREAVLHPKPLRFIIVLPDAYTDPVPADVANRYYKNFPQFHSNVGAQAKYSLVINRGLSFDFGYAFEHLYGRETSTKILSCHCPSE